MPSYTMKDPDGVEHDLVCTIAEMVEKKEQGWSVVFSLVKHGIIGHTGDVISHTPDTFKDRLREIKNKHPGSTIEI
jgi:hypothetical protein|tara:strand:+ start:317 stop:544 length:228 start_codon:yes stop_codon:yes gene_type:complete